MYSYIQILHEAIYSAMRYLATSRQLIAHLAASYPMTFVIVTLLSAYTYYTYHNRYSNKKSTVEHKKIVHTSTQTDESTDCSEQVIPDIGSGMRHNDTEGSETESLSSYNPDGNSYLSDTSDELDAAVMSGVDELKTSENLQDRNDVTPDDAQANNELAFDQKNYSIEIANMLHEALFSERADNHSTAMLICPHTLTRMIDKKILTCDDIIADLIKVHQDCGIVRQLNANNDHELVGESIDALLIPFNETCERIKNAWKSFSGEPRIITSLIVGLTRSCKTDNFKNVGELCIVSLEGDAGKQQIKRAELEHNDAVFKDQSIGTTIQELGGVNSPKLRYGNKYIFLSVAPEHFSKKKGQLKPLLDNMNTIVTDIKNYASDYMKEKDESNRMIRTIYMKQDQKLMVDEQKVRKTLANAENLLELIRSAKNKENQTPNTGDEENQTPCTGTLRFGRN